MRDHGGNLDAAMAEFGGDRSEWIDLSTGINPSPYPLPELPASTWNALPTRAEIASLTATAQNIYGTQAECLPTAGAQAGIQMIPRILKPGTAKIISPTYNEHAASLCVSGWQVEAVSGFDELAGADLEVVVNPNNPDGKIYLASDLIDLSHKVGHLVVDESFADPHPEISVASAIEANRNLIVLRSFGKFYGLAGVRLGFVLGPDALISDLRDLSGPWPVSGAAIHIGNTALRNQNWQSATIDRLADDAARMDNLAQNSGWTVQGGTTLFRLYTTPNAQEAQHKLAEHKIWSRIFPYSDKWIRLGLTEGDENWLRLEAALASQS